MRYCLTVLCVCLFTSLQAAVQPVLRFSVEDEEAVMEVEGEALKEYAIVAHYEEGRVPEAQTVTVARFPLLKSTDVVRLPLDALPEGVAFYRLEDRGEIPVPVGFAPPKFYYQRRPNYPAELQREGVSGEVELSFTVGTDGRVHDLKVVSATHEEFADAALQIVPYWLFLPAMQDGVPVEMKDLEVPISFSIGE